MNRKLEHSNKPEVVVIGGGLAGLVAAGTIATHGRSVEVIERRNSVGGQARSITKNGFTFNQGPHALYRGGPAESILTSLGVRIVGSAPPIKAKIVFQGRPEIGPAGPLTLLRTKALSVGQKLTIGRLLAELPKLVAADFAAVSVDDWIAEIVDDKRPALMLQSLVRLATYVNQPELLSAEVAIEQLQSALKSGVLYLDNGWQSLVDQLRSLPGVTFREGASITELPDASAVIVAVGGPAAASALLGKSFDLGPEAAASCLDLGLSRRPPNDIVIGGDEPFYFSNHSSVAQLAPEGQYHAAAVQYLRAGEQPDDDALQSFLTYAGVEPADVLTKRRLHHMTTVTSIATANRGGLAGRPAVTDTGHEGVFVAGDWVGPKGHLADASVASGQEAALRALNRLAALGK